MASVYQLKGSRQTRVLSTQFGVIYRAHGLRKSPPKSTITFRSHRSHNIHCVRFSAKDLHRGGSAQGQAQARHGELGLSPDCHRASSVAVRLRSELFSLHVAYLEGGEILLV